MNTRFRFLGPTLILSLALFLAPLKATVVTWDVSDLNLVTPPSLGDDTNSGNTALGVWFNMVSGEAYVVDDVAGVPGRTDLANGRYQLRWNVYFRDNFEDGLPSTEVVIQGQVATTRILGTSTAQPSAAAGSPERLAEGASIPTGVFRPASFIEMAGAFGVWQELGRGFLGLFFVHPTLPQFHYGYADITILEGGSIRLNGFAYEDQPNTPITTAFIGAPAPSAASGLSVSGTTATTVSLAWSDNSSNEAGFKIQRRAAGETDFTTVATTAPNATSYTDEGLSAETVYTYRVVATTGLDADPTNEVSATTLTVSGPPAAPSNLGLIPVSPTALELSWQDNANDEVGYRIERSVNGGNFALIATTGPSAEVFSDNGLNTGIPYTYRITATNGQDSAAVTSPTVETFSARESVGADAASSNYPEITGEGVVVGLWDFAPARSTHTEFQSNGSSRLTNVQGGEVSNNSLSNHTTLSAALVGARGADPAAKGVAPDADLEIYMVDGDISDFLSVGMSYPGEPDKLQIANASYGPIRGWNPINAGAVTWTFNASEVGGVAPSEDPLLGAYSQFSAEADNALWQRPYLLLVRSAGNDRDDVPNANDFVYLSNEDANSFTASIYNPDIHPGSDGAAGGYQNVSDAAAGKNTLTVGAINGARRDPSTGNLLFAGPETVFSNWGPTRDGRIKPDLVAPGVSLYSAGYSSDNAYTTLTGSSQSAPLVSGVAALLVEAWQERSSQGALRASTLKGILIHTADDLASPGPDVRTGWGLVNAQAALGFIDAHWTEPSAGRAREGALHSGNTTQSYQFFSDGSGELRATLTWTDPAGSSGSASPLVHDLNLEIEDAAGNLYRPYVLPVAYPIAQSTDLGADAITGLNNVDTVEQIRVALPEGAYTVRISLQGSFAASSQPYSLLVTGAKELSTIGEGPRPIRTTESVSGTLEVRGGCFALGTQVELTGPSGATATATAVDVRSEVITFNYNVGSITDGTWLVRLSAPDGTQSTLRWPVGAGTPRGYEDWLLANFDASELADPSITWFGADHDGDGLPLLLAYAMGASNGQVDTTLRPSIEHVRVDDSTYFEVTYSRLKNSDIALTLEVASDLTGPWSTMSESQIISSNDQSSTVERVVIRDNVAIDSTNPRRFVRIRADWQ